MPDLIGMADFLTKLVTSGNDNNSETTKNAVLSLQSLLFDEVKDGTNEGEAAEAAISIWSSGALQVLGFSALRGCERIADKDLNATWLINDLRKMKESIINTGRSIE